VAEQRHVNLWGLIDFFGAIVPAPTGILWTNQTGGTSCQHPEVEGYFLPLPHSVLGWGDHFRLINVGWGGGAYDVALVQDFLAVNELTGLFEPAPDTRHPFHEAWVPVRIKSALENVPGSTSFVDVVLSGHLGVEVILTYENSD
jgi:hypothetical protein